MPPNRRYIHVRYTYSYMQYIVYRIHCLPKSFSLAGEPQHFLVENDQDLLVEFETQLKEFETQLEEFETWLEELRIGQRSSRLGLRSSRLGRRMPKCDWTNSRLGLEEFQDMVRQARNQLEDFRTWLEGGHDTALRQLRDLVGEVLDSVG